MTSASFVCLWVKQITINHTTWEFGENNSRFRNYNIFSVFDSRNRSFLNPETDKLDVSPFMGQKTDPVWQFLSLTIFLGFWPIQTSNKQFKNAHYNTNIPQEIIFEHWVMNYPKPSCIKKIARRTTGAKGEDLLQVS